MCLFNAKPIRLTESTKCYKLVKRTPDGYRSYVMGTRITDAVMKGAEPYIARGRKDVDSLYRVVLGGYIHSYAESSFAYALNEMLLYDMLERGIELWECRIEPTEEDGFGEFRSCYVSDQKFPEYASDRLWFVRPVVRSMEDLESLGVKYGKRRGFLGGLKYGLSRYIRIVIEKLKSCV